VHDYGLPSQNIIVMLWQFDDNDWGAAPGYKTVVKPTECIVYAVAAAWFTAETHAVALT